MADMTAPIIDLRQTSEWSNFLKSLGWFIEEIDGQKLYIRQFPLIGSIAKFQRPNALSNFQKLDEIAKKYRILFIKVEPGLGVGIDQLKSHGFEFDNWPFLPSKTVHIDLTKSLEEIFDSFSKNARYLVRKAEKQCQIDHYDTPPYHSGSDNLQKSQLKQFHKLLKKVSRKKHFPVSSYNELEKKVKPFGRKAELISVSDRFSREKDMIAGALILFSDNAAFYHHAAADESGKKFFAPYLIIWEAIKLAKRQGAKVFDLEGIYDERYSRSTKNWKSFTVFKKKFGGEIVEYPGVLVRYYNPIARLLFKIF